MRSWVSGLLITLAGCSSGNVAPDAGGSVDGAPRFDAAQGDALLPPDVGQVEVDAGATQDAAPDVGDAAAQVDAGGDAQPGCGSGWCWESPRPTGLGVWSGSGVGSQDGWLVGELGVAFRWDGRAWSLVDTATTSNVLDVHAVSSTLAFAATPSQLIRWNGTAWTPEPGTRGLGLRALWASGSGDVWAVGPGRVLRHDGVSWGVARSDANDWRIVEGRGPDDVWVASSSVVSRWDGVRWVDHRVYSVSSIAVRAADDVWVVADDGEVVHWDGAAWTGMSPTIADGDFSRATEVWTDGARLVLVGEIRHRFTRVVTWLVEREATDWRELARSSAFPTGGARVWGATADDLWLFGGRVVEHWNGRSLEPLSPYSTQYDFEQLKKVWVSPTGSTWACGEHSIGKNGRAIDIARWQAAWRRETLPEDVRTSSCQGIWGSSDTDIWVAAPSSVGSRMTSMIHFDGTSWTAQAGLGGGNDLWGTSAANIWAVGGEGLIGRWDGRGWTAQASPTSQWLYAIDGSSAADAWAVGEQGTLIHWDGMRWTSVAPVDPRRLLEVKVVAPDDAWAVGEEGVVLRWNGSSWAVVDVGAGTETLRAVEVHGSDVWIVSDAGAIYRGNGTSWSVDRTVILEPLVVLWTAAGRLWTASLSGAVLSR